MERADMRTRDSTQCACPLAHLLGRLVGKSYRANTMRAYARINQGCYSICDDCCFSAAGAGDDKQGTFNVADGFSLGRSEWNFEF
jgi:hypothetical protein